MRSCKLRRCHCMRCPELRDCGDDSHLFTIVLDQDARNCTNSASPVWEGVTPVHVDEPFANLSDRKDQIAPLVRGLLYGKVRQGSYQSVFVGCSEIAFSE